MGGTIIGVLVLRCGKMGRGREAGGVVVVSISLKGTHANVTMYSGARFLTSPCAIVFRGSPGRLLRGISGATGRAGTRLVIIKLPGGVSNDRNRDTRGTETFTRGLDGRANVRYIVRSRHKAAVATRGFLGAAGAEKGGHGGIISRITTAVVLRSCLSGEGSNLGGWGRGEFALPVVSRNCLVCVLEVLWPGVRTHHDFSRLGLEHTFGLGTLMLLDAVGLLCRPFVVGSVMPVSAVRNSGVCFGELHSLQRSRSVGRVRITRCLKVRRAICSHCREKFRSVPIRRLVGLTSLCGISASCVLNEG